MNSSDRDPVEDFFERERNQIVSQHGNDVHWQGIVRQARAHRRSRLLGYAAGVAAAGLVIGGITYGAVLHNRAAPLNPATNGGRTAISTPRPIATGEPTPGARARAAAAAAAAAKAAADARAAAEEAMVLKSFATMSISNVGQGNIFVLGSSNCGSAGRCPVLVGSTDNGRTWQLLSSFKSSPVPDAPTRDGVVMQMHGLSQVRFANAKIGWVFGADVQYTTDGGKTFRPYGHLGHDVTDVETDGSQVIVASADGCATRPCTGAYHVARASIGAAAATTEVGTGVAGAVLDTLRVVFDAKQAYLSPQWVGPPTSGFEPQRITSGGLQPLGPLGVRCGEGRNPDIIAPADPQGGLFALCPSLGGGAAGSSGMDVFISNNEGKSWVPVSSGALILVNSGSRSFAAANAHDLIAVSAGDPALHGSIQVSHDGGRSWHSPSSPPPMPTNGWAWVGAPRGKTYYAISADAVPEFWQSDDSGETWTKVGLTS